MQYRWSYAADQDTHQWVMKRNCAMSPRQLGCWFGSLAAVSLLPEIVLCGDKTNCGNEEMQI